MFSLFQMIIWAWLLIPVIFAERAYISDHHPQGLDTSQLFRNCRDSASPTEAQVSDPLADTTAGSCKLSRHGSKHMSSQQETESPHLSEGFCKFRGRSLTLQPWCIRKYNSHVRRGKKHGVSDFVITLIQDRFVGLLKTWEHRHEVFVSVTEGSSHKSMIIPQLLREDHCGFDGRWSLLSSKMVKNERWWYSLRPWSMIKYD